MTREQRHSEFIRFLADGSHFPGTELKVRIMDVEVKSIEITLDSPRFVNVTNALDMILNKANSLSATLNKSDAEYWVTLESPNGTHRNILDVFKKHKIEFSEDTVLMVNTRDKSKLVFSLYFVN